MTADHVPGEPSPPDPSPDPRTWWERQRTFADDYASRRVGAERRPVKVLWWTAAARRGVDVMGAVSQLWTGRRRRAAEAPVFVAVFEATDPIGARPFLVVLAQPGDLPEPAGRATATLVGKGEPDGLLLIETRRAVVSPAEPPGLPGDAAPPWSEVDAPA